MQVRPGERGMESVVVFVFELVVAIDANRQQDDLEGKHRDDDPR